MRMTTEKQTKTDDEATRRRVVLVGTYRGDQLKDWPGWYCWPMDGDVSATKNTKNAKREGRAPSRPSKPHATHYALFKTEPLYRHKNAPQEEADAVIVRLKDFARTPKVRKQLREYLESPDRNDPDHAILLPSVVTAVPPERLRACETAVQLNLFSWEQLQPVHLPRHGEFTAVKLFAGAGGLSIGLERAGIHVVIANGIMPDFAATLAANHPDTNVINENIRRFKEAA